MRTSTPTWARRAMQSTHSGRSMIRALMRAATAGTVSRPSEFRVHDGAFVSAVPTTAYAGDGVPRQRAAPQDRADLASIDADGLREARSTDRIVRDGSAESPCAVV